MSLLRWRARAVSTAHGARHFGRLRTVITSACHDAAMPDAVTPSPAQRHTGGKRAGPSTGIMPPFAAADGRASTGARRIADAVDVAFTRKSHAEDVEAARCRWPRR